VIQQEGFQALPIAASQVIDWEGQKGHVSHKAIAIAAGHGWIGRNNLLVNPLYGSQVRLVTVLTDYPLLTNEPVKANCGTCTLCITVCPARAIHEDRTEFDHRGCFEKLRTFKNSGNIGHYICGICIKACTGPVEQAQERKSRQGKNFIPLKNSKRED
jgi:epoxyqueuosine reductase QueG